MLLTIGTPPKGVNRSLPTFYTLYNYLYCMMASTVLMQRPVLGGALFVSGQVADLATRMLLPGSDLKYLSKSKRAVLIALTLLCGLMTLGLLLVYPRSAKLEGMWMLFSLVMLTALRAVLLGHLHQSVLKRRMTGVQAGLRMAEGALLLIALAAVILFFSLPAQTAWYLLGGYVLTTLLEVLNYRGKGLPAREEPAPGDDDTPENLDHVNAYKTFRKVLTLAVTALQVTMIMIYTYIGTTAGEMFISMAIAFVCTVSVSYLANWVARRKPGRDPGNVMLAGLFLWLWGLVSFGLHAGTGTDVWSYMALATCSAGTAATVTAFWRLDNSMREVVFFATGKRPRERLERTLQLSLEYAQLLGQMIALIGLSLIVFFGERPLAFESGVPLQPLLVLPAVALVFFAVLAALRFPLHKRHMDKLHAFLMLKENGETNVPLQRQLEDVIIKVRKRHYGIRVLMFFLRIFIYNKVIGKEKVKAPKGTSLVFVCNHGEVYGPIVTNLYIPFPLRPWVTSEMIMPEETTNYVYEGTFKRQKWIPARLRYPAAKLVTPIINWAMEGVEGIPVFRNNPRELINTFRVTAAAMEAGDNILIFPENPHDSRSESNFYLRKGVGEFFTGFTMVAPIYYKKTGKRCVFVPVYADKKKHTLTFGEVTAYDPDNEPNAEKERICAYLREEMLRVANLPQEE
jgi:hypothetical protein